MKTPPFLIGATLLFWGWQSGSGLLAAGAVMAVALESSRFIKARWEFSDDDFRRIWTLCTVLLLASAVYAFTSNEGPANFRGLFENPNLSTGRAASNTSARSAAALIRWLPITFFLFVAAQAFSSRGQIPLTTISLIMRLRWKRAQKLGRSLPAARGVDVSHSYFVLCLFAAGVHFSESSSFFLGLCALLTWALWPRRSRRYGPIVWAGTLAVALASGYLSQRGISRLQGLLENYNPQWFAFLSRRGVDARQSRTHIGQIGRVKTSSQIVIRLETPKGAAPPVYLREASYRAYRSETWTLGGGWSEFEDVRSETNNTTWLLLPDKTNTATVHIACYLDGWSVQLRVPSGLLPLPTGCGRLDNLDVVALRKFGSGAVLADGPGLVFFDARYGPGVTMDSPPDSIATDTNDDLTVSDKEVPALEQIISELHLRRQTDPQKLRAISGFFQDKFTYSTWQDRPRIVNTNETPLGRFLLRTRSGHCEYFATATVLLLRQLNIPARYAVGYAVHEASGKGYVVRQRDAHAWCIVWDGQTWRDFDTTPASWVAEENKRASLFQFLSDFWSRIGFEFSKFRWGQSHIRQYAMWALLPMLALLFYQAVFRRKWRRQLRKPGERERAAHWPGLDSEFYQIESRLAQRATPRQPGEPLSDWLQRAAKEPALADLRAPLRELLHLHYRYRFDPEGLNASDREALRRAAQTCLAGLERNKR